MPHPAIPETDVIYRPGLDQALDLSAKAMEAAFNGWDMRVRAYPDLDGNVTLEISHAAPPTEH